MNRQQIAAELAEAIGVQPWVLGVTKYKDDRELNALGHSPDHVAMTTRIDEAIQKLERRGLLVLVTDDRAVFSFPVEKGGVA